MVYSHSSARTTMESGPLSSTKVSWRPLPPPSTSSRGSSSRRLWPTTHPVALAPHSLSSPPLRPFARQVIISAVGGGAFVGGGAAAASGGGAPAAAAAEEPKAEEKKEEKEESDDDMGFSLFD
ncbi:hypothetical protein SLEP1_g13105 [Rubroshorea leprosula]|uniref:60S acidic ribosomal protein P3 n=1 Tax=Rubroshorea leprosula TaxID=152421 RepID=A0AAV5INV2_9ROSI|nr:hypothetical protein SLEP1_g13105 [Rubroshorea leprosula]